MNRKSFTQFQIKELTLSQIRLILSSVASDLRNELQRKITLLSFSFHDRSQAGDRVYVVQDGQIVEQGKHEELLAQMGSTLRFITGSLRH